MGSESLLNIRAECVLLLGVITIFASCGPPPRDTPLGPVPNTPEGVRVALTEAMIRADHCYMDSLEYAIRDPEFLDRALADLLGKKTLQEVAANPHDFEELARAAPTFYMLQSQTDDGLVRLARVVAERFAHPVVTVKERTVRADYGHIAAKFSHGARQPIIIYFRESPHMDETWEWRSNEVAAALQDLRDRYPEAEQVEARVLIPGGTLGTEWIYSYRPDNDRILVSILGRHFQTDVLNHDFGKYSRGGASLDTRDLHSLDKY